MLNTLPNAIDAYFKASNIHDTASMLLCFAQDAIVHDETRNYRGVAAIGEWINVSTAEYQPITQVIGTNTLDDETVVTGQVTGNFEGSPVTLQFHFTMNNDKIAALSID